jgi:hypothetical protein
VPFWARELAAGGSNHVFGLAGLRCGAVSDALQLLSIFPPSWVVCLGVILTALARNDMRVVLPDTPNRKRL